MDLARPTLNDCCHFLLVLLGVYWRKYYCIDLDVPLLMRILLHVMDRGIGIVCL